MLRIADFKRCKDGDSEHLEYSGAKDNYIIAETDGMYVVTVSSEDGIGAGNYFKTLNECLEKINEREEENL